MRDDAPILRVVTPATNPLTTDAAKEHLRVIDNTDDDTYITGLVAAAFSTLQPPRGWLGRSIARQTLRLDMRDWGCREIKLPAGPITSISSLKYWDANNAQVTVDTADYFLATDTLCFTTTFTGACVYPRPDAIQITYIAGHDDVADPLPEGVMLGMKQLVSHWYENREPVSIEQVFPTEIPMMAEAMLAPFRLYA